MQHQEFVKVGATVMVVERCPIGHRLADKWGALVADLRQHPGNLFAISNELWITVREYFAHRRTCGYCRVE